MRPIGLIRLIGPIFLLCLLLLPCQAQTQVSAQDTTAKPEPRSPLGAMIRSAVFPGWGQFYSDHYVKASLFFALESGLVISAINENRKANDVFDTDYEAYLDRIDKRNSLLWWTAGVVVYSMVDAYVDAHLFGFDEDQVSLGLESGEIAGEVRLVLRFTVPEVR